MTHMEPVQRSMVLTLVGHATGGRLAGGWGNWGWEIKYYEGILSMALDNVDKDTKSRLQARGKFTVMKQGI
ncbi:hypothetical protein K9N68_31650 [Kovacikia minuta CCNUW1]|uniref:hypothetical protein n=1 Tax=Kovacikia minuta TaxID=2931930 RepID=UPI001CCF584E|nr:hypothetical protein [Kovacikia minuta]UBF26040.1 hypothetical protein K9N68_31650 [Kovacikia minuta CCNUW1]